MTVIHFEIKHQHSLSELEIEQLLDLLKTQVAYSNIATPRELSADHLSELKQFLDDVDEGQENYEDKVMAAAIRKMTWQIESQVRPGLMAEVKQKINDELRQKLDLIDSIDLSLLRKLKDIADQLR